LFGCLNYLLFAVILNIRKIFATEQVEKLLFDIVIFIISFGGKNFRRRKMNQPDMLLFGIQFPFQLFKVITNQNFSFHDYQCFLFGRNKLQQFRGVFVIINFAELAFCRNNFKNLS